ncbi:universal stress protein [Nocardia sp. alder85J]|uniref:universal stress protein n=1 Tax=Nocardia sp. alder85J TaxID=2862949 RepID=UPI001CD5D130|nr:universal stress protein [Nocardia sp. alder85J]MCX4092437.1 universal stress protein [Nocardia sp. alder85J]
MDRQHNDDPHHLASAAVVAGIDGSQASETALMWAADMADRCGRELRIVHSLALNRLAEVYNRYDVSIPAVLDAMRTTGEVYTGKAVAAVRRRYPRLRVSSVVSEDDPGPLLVRSSAGAYRVVIGTTGASGWASHLGSIVLAVTSHAHGAVVVVRTDPDAGKQVRAEGPVVVGVDGDPVGEPALAAAFEEAAERGAELVVVHVWADINLGKYADDPYLLESFSAIAVTEEALLAERLAGWQEKYPEVAVTRMLYPLDPATVLIDWSTRAQLVVVGSRGRGGFRGLLLGSTSNSLVQHAHCPVMVVRPH